MELAGRIFRYITLLCDWIGFGTIEAMKTKLLVSPCSAPTSFCKPAACLVYAAFMLLPFLSANAFELDLRTARIEANAVNESQKRAVKELEKHLSMIAGWKKPSSKSAHVVFVLGRCYALGAR